MPAPPLLQLPGLYRLAAFMPAPPLLQVPGPFRLAAFMPAPPLLQLPGLYRLAAFMPASPLLQLLGLHPSLPSRLPLSCFPSRVASRPTPLLCKNAMAGALAPHHAGPQVFASFDMLVGRPLPICLYKMSSSAPSGTTSAHAAVPSKVLEWQ